MPATTVEGAENQHTINQGCLDEFSEAARISGSVLCLHVRSESFYTLYDDIDSVLFNS